MVAILACVTFGIYALIWMVKTKNEMNKCGVNPPIPTAWMLLIPFIGPLLFQWKFSGGVEHVTQGKSSQAMTFILLFVLSVIGMAIVQSSLNQAIDRGVPGQLPAARVA
jgi:hypothetical protein